MMRKNQVLSNNITAIYSSGNLQLLRAGCPIESRVVKNSDRNDPLTSRRIDGFAVNVTNEDFLVLEGLQKGEHWKFIGQSSDFRKVPSGVRFFGTSSGMYGRLKIYDFRVPWPLMLVSSATSFAFACGYGGLLLLRYSGFAHRSRHLLFLTFLALAALNLTAGLGYLSLGLSRESFYPFWIFCICAALASVLWLAEWALFETLAALAALACLGRCAEDCLLFDDCPHWSHDPPLAWMLLLMACAVFLSWRTRLLIAITSTRMKVDRDFHRETWRKIAETEGDALARIGALSACANAACAAQHLEARHYNRMRKLRQLPPPPPPTASARGQPNMPAEPAGPSTSPSANSATERAPADGYELIDSHKNTEPGSIDRARPVSSLDQLYAQAIAASAELSRLAAAWAIGSGGEISEGPAAAGPKDPLLGCLPPAGRELVRLGAVKGPSRAVAKAAACHGGDASRLTDVCRARIRFGAAAGVAACLERVCADAAVRVVRVKDGMGSGGDAWLSAGFRVPPPAPPAPFYLFLPLSLSISAAAGAADRKRTALGK
jgi:hypothetical protein